MDGADLLRIWERGLGKSPAQRAVALLTHTAPGDQDSLDRLPPGMRDERLLDLREQLFGGRLMALANCTACGEALEFESRTEDLRMAEPAPQSGPLAIECEGVNVSFRLPDSRDLAALEGGGNWVDERRRLFERCILSARREESGISVADLSDAVLAAVSKKMAESDPTGDLRLELQCPACRATFEAPFDIAAYLWTELQAAAHRLLGEIHLLASAYGWSEEAILRLGPGRRQAYLELIAR